MYVKTRKYQFIPDTSVGLGKPRGDIVTSPLYPTVVVETPATPPTTWLKHQPHHPRREYNIQPSMRPLNRSVHRGAYSATFEIST